MNSDSICSKQIDFQDNTKQLPLKRIFSPIVGLYANLQNAYRVQQQAKSLYAMSDADLNAMNLTRESIPSHLAKLF